jgi:hypothetical protein
MLGSLYLLQSLHLHPPLRFPQLYTHTHTQKKKKKKKKKKKEEEEEEEEEEACKSSQQND